MKFLFLSLLLSPFFGIAQDTTAPYFERDKFVTDAFGFPMTIKNFKSHYGKLFTISKTTVKNAYDTSVIDTVYSFHGGDTKIEIYHSKLRDILKSAFISDARIALKENVRVGMSKSEFERILQLEIPTNRFEVGDLEHNQVYIFSFSGDKLISIEYEGYIE